ncbi:MAG: hypothetical protein AAGA95_21950 [Pseudomonadota bacterium]
MTRALLMTTLLALLTTGCNPDDSELSYAVLVEVTRSGDMTDAELRDAFLAAEAGLNEAPGLERAYLVHTPNSVGRVYLWRTRADAEAYFDERWQARVEDIHGGPPKATWFLVPAQTSGASPGSAGGDGVVVIVRVRTPWYAPQRLVASRMRDSIPQYSAIAGLDYKIYSITEDRMLGGIYLWENQAAVDDFYDAAWHDGIRERYGEDARLDRFTSTAVLITDPTS